MENIQVGVRIKPVALSGKDCLARSNSKTVLADNWKIYDSGNTIENLKTKQRLQFDYLFNESSTNLEIFQQLVLPYLNSATHGVNLTIFAYGQTSSGKTFTINGSPGSPGLILLTLKYIIDTINIEFKMTKLKISYLEVYNEQVNDLLDCNKKNLEIRELPDKKIYVEGLTEYGIDSLKQALELVELGESNKKIAGTCMNANSSRSHTVFRIMVDSCNEYFIQTSQINLIDLAGSEGVGKSGTEDARLREGSNINKSLLCLSSVIERLSNNKGQKNFVNFRSSKMTRLLQPALTGNSHISIICTISMDPIHYGETYNTLLFGTRAKKIKNDAPIQDIIYNEKNIQLLEDKNKELSKKLAGNEILIENFMLKLDIANGEIQKLEKNSIAKAEEMDFKVKSLKKENVEMKELIKSLEDLNQKCRTDIGNKDNECRVVEERGNKALNDIEINRDALQIEKNAVVFELDHIKMLLNKEKDENFILKKQLNDVLLELDKKNVLVTSLSNQELILKGQISEKNDMVGRYLIELEGNKQEINEKNKENADLAINAKENLLKILEIQEKNLILDKKDEEIATLRSEIHEKNRSIFQMLKNLQHQRVDIEEKSADLLENDLKFKDLYSELDGKNWKISVLTEEKLEKTSECVLLNQEIELLRAKINDLAKELEEAQEFTLKLIEEGKNKDQTIMAKNSQVAEKDQIIASKDKQIMHKDKQLYNKAQLLTEKDKENSDLATENSVSEQQIDYLNDEVKNLNIIIDKKDAENDLLVEEINEKNAQIKKLANEMTDQQIEIRNLMTKLRNSEGNLINSHKEMENLNQNSVKMTKSLYEKLEIASFDVKKLNETIMYNDMAKVELENEINSLKNWQKDLVRRNDILEQTLNAKKLELNAVSMKCEGFERELSLIKKENNSLVADCDAKMQENETFKAKIIELTQFYKVKLAENDLLIAENKEKSKKLSDSDLNAVILNEKIANYEKITTETADFIQKLQTKLHFLESQNAKNLINFNTSLFFPKGQSKKKKSCKNPTTKKENFDLEKATIENMEKWDLEAQRLEEIIREKKEIIDKISKDLEKIVNLHMKNAENCYDPNFVMIKDKIVQDLQNVLDEQYARISEKDEKIAEQMVIIKVLDRKNCDDEEYKEEIRSSVEGNDQESYKNHRNSKTSTEIPSIKSKNNHENHDFISILKLKLLKSESESQQLEISLSNALKDHQTLIEQVKLLEEKCRAQERQIFYKRNSCMIFDENITKHVNDSERYKLLLELRNNANEIKLLKENYEVESIRNKGLVEELCKKQEVWQRLEEENKGKDQRNMEKCRELEERVKDLENILDERELIYDNIEKSLKKIRPRARFGSVFNEIKENRPVFELGGNKISQ